MTLADQFHDACGMGLLAHLRRQASHQLLQDAIRALTRMMHRGAIAADELANINASRPCRARRSTNQPSTPAEYECRSTNRPMPLACVAATSGASPAS